MFSNVVQCCPMRSHVFQCGLMWFNVFQCGPIWSNVVCFGSMLSDVVRCGLMWSDVVRCGLMLSYVDHIRPHRDVVLCGPSRQLHPSGAEAGLSWPRRTDLFGTFYEGDKPPVIEIANWTVAACVSTARWAAPWGQCSAPLYTLHCTVLCSTVYAILHCIVQHFIQNSALYMYCAALHSL